MVFPVTVVGGDWTRDTPSFECFCNVILSWIIIYGRFQSDSHILWLGGEGGTAWQEGVRVFSVGQCVGIWNTRLWFGGCIHCFSAAVMITITGQLIKEFTCT